MVLHAIIKGKVQGVGYRYFTQKIASELKLKGWVKNNPDGTVEVWAEGDENTLNIFLDNLRKGPPLSFVEDIKYEFIDKEGGFADFEIRY
ncbi:acylphosphatase [Hydrogenivirga sp. 128-5-R1-1]|uniref:acylphosphatase n=1 Tax=Hydrogenivirga sp. 128-5-R1-1 TaxID=392423 RepID=UPI00015F114B|nr:acylphosphatase [Hydrogenivirga sp. 128-5-R1-1]EDP74212.1 YflL [Hydrogenivirga sp. 128-5-R1-1]